MNRYIFPCFALDAQSGLRKWFSFISFSQQMVEFTRIKLLAKCVVFILSLSLCFWTDMWAWCFWGTTENVSTTLRTWTWMKIASPQCILRNLSTAEKARELMITNYSVFLAVSMLGWILETPVASEIAKLCGDEFVSPGIKQQNSVPVKYSEAT